MAFDITSYVLGKKSAGGGGGGGGSSDFSTATVTVTITKEAAYFDIPSVINTPIETLMNYQCNWTNGGGQFITPLYKGSAYLPANIPLDANTSVTGDAILDGEAFYITGDCTITIS